LKTVQDVNRLRQSHRVNRSISITAPVLDDLHRSGRPEPFERLRILVQQVNLRVVKANPKTCCTSSGMAISSLLVEPIQRSGLSACFTLILCPFGHNDVQQGFAVVQTGLFFRVGPFVALP
jgi:hypothetical protein